MSDNNVQVKAKSFWVWTKKAENKNPARAKEGAPAHDNYLYSAPQWMLDEGLIQDAEDAPQEGQTSIFDFM